MIGIEVEKGKAKMVKKHFVALLAFIYLFVCLAILYLNQSLFEKIVNGIAPAPFGEFILALPFGLLLLTHIAMLTKNKAP